MKQLSHPILVSRSVTMTFYPQRLILDGSQHMAFASWCLCHADDVRRRLDALEQQILRRRLAQEAQAAHAAMIARWTSELGIGISRDIREWRVEV